MKRTLCLLILFSAFFALNQTARAQELLYSIAHVEQFGNPSDPSSVMAGYSVTGMTYGMALWYNAVQFSTLERDGLIVDQQVSENFPNTVNYTQAPLLAGSVYTQYTDTGTHVLYTYVCGTLYDAYGLINYAYLPYEDNHQWNPFPAICIFEQFLYLGYTAEQAQASQPTQPCNDTCSPCKRDRRNRFIICATAGGSCGVAAYAVYANAINNCENQAICNPASPMFNQQQCDNCKNSAENTFIAALSACGSAGTACILTLPDCSGKQSCPNGPNGQPGPCN